MWLVHLTDRGLRVELDAQRIEQLQRVLPDDFVRSEMPKLLGENDVRFKTACSMRHISQTTGRSNRSTNKLGIARGEFEVRCGSDVVSTNDRMLGHVAGYLVRHDLVTALVVRSGIVGFQKNVVVPVNRIATVVPPMVLLDLDRHEFRQLSTTTVLPEARAKDRAQERVVHAAAHLMHEARDRVYAARSRWI